MKIDANIRIGDDAGESLYDMISRCKKRLVVVSPWISGPNADLLLRKQKEGVSVELVTTNDPSPNHMRALDQLAATESRVVRKGRPAVSVVGAVFLMAALVLFTSSLGAAVVSAAVGGTVIWLSLPRTKKFLTARISKLTVHDRATSKLHAKIYVADNQVAVGSANFTVTGFHAFEGVAFLNGDGIAERALAQLENLNQTKKAQVLYGR